MSKNLCIIGGDLRIVKLVEILVNDGYTVYTYALEEAESLNQYKNVIQCKTIVDAISTSTEYNFNSRRSNSNCNARNTFNNTWK